MADMVNNLQVPLAGWTVPRPVFKRLDETFPTTYPTTAAKVKTHLRITHNADDDYITDLIPVATQMVEQYLSRRLIARAAQMWMDFIPGTGNEYTLYGAGTAQVPVRYANIGMFRWFELMGTPVSAWDSIHFVTDAGVDGVFDPSQYIVDITDKDMPARLILQRGAVWPVDLRVAKGLYCKYTLGYGATADAVPPSLRHGVLLVAGALYSNRGDAADQPLDILSLPGVRAALAPYRVLKVSTLS
jgi:hypothetical protein